ncbi:hypothetical protein Q9L58_005485 [Maublancomyces gigas]|uniref:F-box domain-containing protein n=1 Tax=Discina gigas TaxID=1032678 RepID=A0ABR3GI09_9PEZI
MPPRKKPRTETTKPASSSRARTSYNPSKHSLASLPYHVLSTILIHAATTPAALHDWPSPSFLLSCATLCRTLHDPAIAVLYRNPPTLPPTRAHRLLNTLRERPGLGRKIKRLVVEVDPLLTTKLGRVAWDVCEFVLLARGLQDIQFAHEVDKPPYREESRMKLGWRYPDALWDALEGRGHAEQAAVEGLRLRSWKWSGRFIGSLSFVDIGRINGLRSFSTLTSISLIYIDTLDVRGLGDGLVEKNIAGLVSSLPDLRDIKFECSSIVNHKLLTLLSTSASHLKLRELRLINCPLLEASDCSSEPGLGLTSFLQQPPCRSLQVLEVASCRFCPLTFIAALSSTPLRHILRGATPLSDSALIAWPATLRSITATSLRMWSSGECIAFLSSLVDAAPRMQHMKRVSIWCMLTDIDWRERAEFREKWSEGVGAAFGAAEKVEVRFDNARPAEQLWREGDFLQDGGSVLARAMPRTRTRAAKRVRAKRGAGVTGKRVRVGSGGAKRKVVVLSESESEGDEEYNDDD